MPKMKEFSNLDKTTVAISRIIEWSYRKGRAIIGTLTRCGQQKRN